MKHIIAMGGGGFSMEPDNLLLDRYVLGQSQKDSPKICFIPTASAENVDYNLQFYSTFVKLGCRPGHLSLYKQPQADLLDYILGFDIVYVGGGNTRCMLALWREWDLHNILKTALDEGIILAGISAGAICWFEQGITDSVPGDLTVMDCLGYLPGSCCPHYDGEENRRPSYHKFVGTNAIKPGYALEDGAAAHFVDGELLDVVSSRPNAKAYWVDQKADGDVIEKPIAVRYLGKD